MFALLATLNTAGYRYGASDQAFYIPAVLQQLDSSLFPRDVALIVSQGRLSVFEELFAGLVRLTGWSLPTWFAIGYAAALLLLFAALVRLGNYFYSSAWSTAALVFACALRHRITKTGVNTLEGYFQPRILTFALGLLAIDAVLRKRPALAAALLLVGGVLHTTTALWFSVWVGVALAVEDARLRKPIIALGVVGAVGALALFATGALSLTPMDGPWLQAFAGKDYIFPTQWALDTWLLNLLLPAIVLGVFLWRRRAGLLRPRETGLVCGCLALIAIFLLALPLIAARSAFVTQLQVSRLFWMSDLLATIYVVWLATEAGARGAAVASTVGRAGAAADTADGATTAPLSAFAGPFGRRAAIVALLLGLVALGRGWYVLFVEHPGRPLAEIGFPADEWTDASRWLRTHTPKDAQLLADPGHAWRYGLSLRVSAERDVLLEEVKDSAIALYGRPIATRVTERTAALGDFPALTADGVRALASRYDLDYLVTERPLPLPEVYRNSRFHVYRLDAGQHAGPAPPTP